MGNDAGCTGSFSLNGGSLTVGTAGAVFTSSEYVGLLGTGSFTQFGGSHTIGTAAVNQNLYVGYNSAALGSYTLNNAVAGLTVNGNAYLGGSNTAAGGTGTLNVSAGTATISGLLKIWNTPDSEVNLTGGILNLGALDVSGNRSQFNWNGGTLNFINGVTIDSNFALGQSLALNPLMTLSTSGTLTNNGLISLSGGTLSVGNLIMNGALSFQSGTLNITGAGGLTISPTGPLKDNIMLGSGQALNVSSSTIVASGSSLSVSGGAFTAALNVANAGNIVLNSGALKLNGGLNNQAGGLLVVGQNSTATVNSTLTNASEIQLGGAAATLLGTGTLNNAGLIRGDGIIAKNVNNNIGGEIRGEVGNRIKLTGINGLNAGRDQLARRRCRIHPGPH